MSILNKMNNLSKAVAGAGKVPMTDEQVVQCKKALIDNNRGYNVQPNKWDISMPYRVAINYNNEWANFGNFSSVDVAAAIGTIVSAGYFGENAKAGDYNQEVAESHEEFLAWMADSRNADIIARASGEAPSIHQPRNAAAAESDANPF